MDHCHVNQSCCRPYQTTCGMGRPMPRQAAEKKSVLEHADHLPLAMAYVPCQKFHTTFDLCHAFHVGTVFPELCMPFCGKRGMCR